MGFHTFDVERASELEDETRYRYCSREDLLELIGPHERMEIADLGSGTGFFADDVAPHVGTLYAVDMQDPMHEHYQEKGVPENVQQVHAPVDDLPLDDDSLDAAFSVDTYHEYHSDASIKELARVVRPGGRVITVDWSATGDQDAGPPLDERFALADTVSHFSDAGFTIEAAKDRAETYVCTTRR
jgi:ubiquinone/menaquinone biosynthesis C-methylase UbiE